MWRPAFLLLCMLLAACATGERPLDRYPGLEQMIREAYTSYALERHATCIWPEIAVITQQRIVRDDPQWLVAEIRYHFRPLHNMGSGSDRAACSGFATRRFVFRKTERGLELWDISGDRRTTPYFTFYRGAEGEAKIGVPPFLEGWLPLPETLPRREPGEGPD